MKFRCGICSQVKGVTLEAVNVDLLPENSLLCCHQCVSRARLPLNSLSRECHEANRHWWTDLVTGERLNRNKGELLMLVVSEIAECMEGERKKLKDDHLPHRWMAEVELADALIRIFDYAGAYGYDLDGAVAEKRAYNMRRADHKREARLSENGKQW